MDRRGFLNSILAACAAPAIVRADSLMRVIPRETAVIGVDPGQVSTTEWVISYDQGKSWRTYYLAENGLIVQPPHTILRSPYQEIGGRKLRWDIQNLVTDVHIESVTADEYRQLLC